MQPQYYSADPIQEVPENMEESYPEPQAEVYEEVSYCFLNFSYKIRIYYNSLISVMIETQLKLNYLDLL